MRAVVMMMLGLAMSASADAQPSEMPNYDVDRQCRRIASMGGSYSESLFGACFDSEQAAYDGLKARWAALPATIRGQCDRIARMGGAGSYSLLQVCVQQEEAAGHQNQQRQFRR